MPEIESGPKSLSSESSPADLTATLRVAVASSSSGLSAPWAWALTFGVILGVGLAAYGMRSVLAPALDRWIPALERSKPVVEEVEETTVEMPVAPSEPSEPPWTFVEIETALRPLPEDTMALIDEGRGELGEFGDLSSSDETRALLMGNRWRLWRRVWRNRVAQIRDRMPPVDDCALHAALEPTCRSLDASLDRLARIVSSSTVEAATLELDAATQILDELLREEPVAE